MQEKTGIGKFIAKRRKCLNLTQKGLADLIGVSKSAIAKWETEGGFPDRENLRKLAAAIDIPVDDLHRMISGQGNGKLVPAINITTDVIATLESYGYKVIRPGEQKEDSI